VKTNTTSSFLHDKTKALYQPWSEEVFQADMYVRYMTPVQRWMYRTLCQAAFACSERPYLPDNDAMLWMLAGCESAEQWAQNGAPVRAMFVPIEKEGIKLLSRKRLTEDWTRIQDALAAQREVSRLGGLASAAKRKSNHESTAGEPTVNQRSTNGEPKSTNVTELNGTERNGTEQNLPTNPPANSDGGEAGSSATESNPNGTNAGRKTETALTFADLQDTWTHYRHDGHDELSIGLPRSGFSKLETKLRAFNLLIRVEDIKSAFQIWLEDRYCPAQDEWNDIKSPLSVFANDVVQYITTMETREGKS
jgi:hypothetical protein